MDKKIRIGWFSFTCSEDSLIVFTELLNKYYFQWEKVIEFAHAKILKSKNDMTNLDIAFIEGAISSDDQAEKLKKIRENAKKLVAVGSCAVTGMPSGARNDFSPEVLKKFEKQFNTFQYSKKVKKISDVVKVDDSIPGCPMNGEEFTKKLNRYLEEFKSQNAPPRG